MNFKTTALVSMVTLGLIACGGGGGDTAADTATATTTDSTPTTTPSGSTPTTTPSGTTTPAPSTSGLTEFLGTWHDTDTECHGRWAYNTNTWIKAGDAVFTETTIEAPQIVYTDAACTAKAGKFTEKYTVTYTPGSVAGRTNVLQVDTVYSGFTISADGGSGLTLTSVPERANFKALFDVDSNGRLNVSDDNSPRDANGYPTVFSTSRFWIR